MRLFFIFILLFTTIYNIYPDYIQKEYRCDICGKYLHKWEEVKSEWYGEGSFIYSDTGIGHFAISDNKTVCEFIFNKKLYLCEECVKQYSKIFENQMNELWTKLLTKYQNENKTQKAFAEYKHRKKKLKAIDDEILKLKEKKEQIKENK